MKRLLLFAALLPCCLAAQTGTVLFKTRLDQSEAVNWDWTETANLRLGTDSFPLIYNDSLDNWEALHLRPGTYTLHYETIFQQQQQLQFQHDGRSATVQDVDLGAFTESPTQYALLEHLAPGDSLRLEYYAYGCEPWDGGTLEVVRLDKKRFEVTFTRDDHPTVQRMLDPQQMRRLVTFERQVRALKDNGYYSSMTHCFEISQHGESVFLVKNVEHTWDGMRYLQYYLFDQPAGIPAVPPLEGSDVDTTLYVEFDNPVSAWRNNQLLPVERMRVSMGELKVGPQPGTILLSSYWPGPLTLTVELPQDTFYKTFIVKPLPIEAYLGGKFRDGSQLPNGEFKAQGGLTAFVNCCGFDAPCEVDSFVVIRHAKDGSFGRVTNHGAAFEPDTDRLIQKALPGDTYLFQEISGTCPGDFESRELPAVTVRIRG